jgi:hypothetical protein
MEQVVWWAHNTTKKLTWMESHMKEIARMLGCILARVVEVLKEKMATFDRMDNLHDQREKDLKPIQKLQTNVARLNFEKSLLNKLGVGWEEGEGVGGESNEPVRRGKPDSQLGL